MKTTRAFTPRNHCAHVTRFYETKIQEDETRPNDEVFKLLGVILEYLVAEH